MSETGETVPTLGIIGGSGLYDIEGLEGLERKRLTTPWGEPSSEIVTGRIGGHAVAFLPRHGPGHRIPPSEINYRANIDALKRCGATAIVSVSACGSFREELSPGSFVIVDQFLDRTHQRPRSFFGHGCVAHVSLAHPVCTRLCDLLEQAAREAGGTPVHRGGTYLAMEGPQFSTLAESRIYRETLDCAVIGMTNMPEARLAREAELCYATLAMVTDYDSWHPEHGEVDVRRILEVMARNVEAARKTLQILAQAGTAAEGDCCEGCNRALEYAVITAAEHRDPELVARLDAIAGRVLDR